MKKSKYVVQSIVDETPLAGSVIFRMNPNQPPYLVIPKRYSLEFYEIKNEGINPKFIIPFHKTIYSLKVMPASHWGKPSTIDVIVLFFFDTSFIIFNDPSKPLFRYNPISVKKYNDYLVDTHPNKPFIIFGCNNGLINFWDGLQPQRQEKVYKIPLNFEAILDFKFLKTSDLMISALVVVDDQKKIVTKNVDLTLLYPNENSDLTIDIEDQQASLIIPLKVVDDDSAHILVLGSCITVVAPNSTISVECPFKGRPTTYAAITDTTFVCADESGQILFIDSQEDISFKLLGSLPTIPTSITYIDNGIFFISSRIQDAFIVQFSDKNMNILSKIQQFRPSTFCSKYSDLAGCVFISHGTKLGGGAITSLRSGAFFTEQYDSNISSIFSLSKVGDEDVMISTYYKSIIFNTNKMTVGYTNDVKTITSFKTNNGIIQITPESTFLIKNGKIEKTIDITADCGCFNSKDRFAIALDNNIKIFDLNLNEIKSISCDNQIKSIASHNKFLAVCFWDGTVTMYKDVEILKSSKLHDFTPDTIFIIRNDVHARICVIYLDGTAIIATKELDVMNKTTFGHICSGSFINDETSVFVLGSSPSIFYSDGSSIPAIISDFAVGARVNNSTVCFADQSRFVIGKINESELCQTSTKDYDVTPFLMATTKNPPALFAGYYREGDFGVMGLSLPSMVNVFDISLSEVDELSSLIRLGDNRICFGTSGQNEGKITIVEDVFGTFSIAGNYTLEGGVFSMSALNENLLIVCGRCRLFMIKIETTAAGAVLFETLQAIQCPSICRSVFSINQQIVILMDSFRSIIAFKLNNNFLDRVNEFPMNRSVVSGCIGSSVKPGTIDLLTADEDSTIHIIRMKADTCEMKEISSAKLTSPVSSLSKVRDGFIIATTQNGGVSLFVEVSPEVSHSLKKARSVLYDIFRCDGESLPPIVDATPLIALNSMTQKLLKNFLDARNTTTSELNTAIQAVKARVAKLCSTLV